MVLCTIIILALAALISPIQTYAAEIDGWKYSVNNGVATITYYNGTSKDVVIPSTLNGVKVTKIGKNAFFMSKFIENVTILGNIKTIEECAFQQCTSIKSIVMQEGVETIEDNAFLGCINLESVKLADSITTIGTNAFSGCSFAEISLPKNLKLISNRSFQCNKELASVEIPNGVKSIGDYAFNECYNLTTLIIPDSVESIGTFAFADTKIEELNLSGVKLIKNRAFSAMYALKEIKIPEYWTSIQNWEFGWCRSIEQIYIPDTIKTIGNAAFEQCDNLTTVFIPSSVEFIGTNVFNGSPNAYIIVDENNQYYSSEDGVLYNKDKTKLLAYPSAKGNITVDEGVITIAKNAFKGTLLDSLKLPKTLKTIEERVFYGCEELNIVEMPSAVTIGDKAFAACKKLREVKLPDNLKTIGTDAFYRCYWLDNVTIPKNVTEIGECAFGYESDNWGNPILNKDFHIDGFSGSTAQKYAAINNIEFWPIDKDITLEQAKAEANSLYALGLFLGTNKGFALEEMPTRLQGVIMLIRMMGEEEAAKNCTYTHPFTDVPAWGDRYVAWAYAKKYTAGTSATTFSSTENMTAQHYLAFTIRALGYGKDSVYANTISDAVKFGLIPQDLYKDTTTPFLRADVVHITYTALTVKEKSSGLPLYQDLINKGAIDSKLANNIFNPKQLTMEEIKDFLGY